MKKMYSSNRIYKNKLEKNMVGAIEQSIVLFNRAKHTSYNRIMREERTKKRLFTQSEHLLVKQTFGLNDYWANSVVQEANAVHSSQMELRKMYVENEKERVKKIKKRLKQEKSRLTVLKKIKESFIKGKPNFNKTSREQWMGSFFVVQYKHHTDLYYNTYDFEHMYLDKEIRNLKQRIGLIQGRLNRTEEKAKRLPKKVVGVTFGSKKLFKGQFTVSDYEKDHDRWRKDWDKKRYNQFMISGRKDSKQGNFVFTYSSETKTLHFLTPQGVPIQLHIFFKYGQEKIEEAINLQLGLKQIERKRHGKPMAWGIEDHGAYFIVKCVVEQDENPYKNHSKVDGVVGVDCNVNHFAWSEINRKGQLIKHGVIEFDIEKKTSGQITKIIEQKAIEVVDLAVKCHKPIVVEKLDTTKSKSTNVYGTKKQNRRMSQFAYKKMLDSIKNRAEKMGVVVYEVNPAYTSQIGKMKYMKRFGISIHVAASFVIARRAMHFKEQLPPMLRALLPEKITSSHHWVHWKHVSNALKDIRVHRYYQSMFTDNSMLRSTNELFAREALTNYEQKGVEAFVKKALS